MVGGALLEVISLWQLGESSLSLCESVIVLLLGGRTHRIRLSLHHPVSHCIWLSLHYLVSHRIDLAMHHPVSHCIWLCSCIIRPRKTIHYSESEGEGRQCFVWPVLVWTAWHSRTVSESQRDVPLLWMREQSPSLGSRTSTYRRERAAPEVEA